MKYSNCLSWDNVSLMQSMDPIWYQVFVDLVNNLQLSLRQNGAVHLNIQYVPWNMHTVCAVYWLSDAVACSGLQCMGRVWVYAPQYASDIYKRGVTPITRLGSGLLTPDSSLWLFYQPVASELSKHWSPIQYYIHICNVSQQLSCHISTWFRENSRYVCTREK